MAPIRDLLLELAVSDFVLVRRTGEFYILGVKVESERGNSMMETKKISEERLQSLQSDNLRYHITYAVTGTKKDANIKPTKDRAENQEC